jgi:hypothetical protein
VIHRAGPCSSKHVQRSLVETVTADWQFVLAAGGQIL